MQESVMTREIPEEFKFEPAGLDKTPVIANLSDKILILHEPSQEELLEALIEVEGLRAQKYYEATKNNNTLFETRRYTYNRGPYLKRIRVGPMCEAGVSITASQAGSRELQQKVIAFLDAQPAHRLSMFLAGTSSLFNQGWTTLRTLNFEPLLDYLFTGVFSEKREMKGIRGALLLKFWTLGWILLPSSSQKRNILNTGFFSNKKLKAVSERNNWEIQRLLSYIRNSGNGYPFLQRLLLCTTCRRANDLSQVMLDYLLEDAEDDTTTQINANSALHRYLISNQSQFGGTSPHIQFRTGISRKEELKRKEEARYNRGSGTFEWAIRENPRIRPWVEFIHLYTKSQKRLVGHAALCFELNRFLDFLLYLSKEVGEKILEQLDSPEKLQRNVHIAPHPIRGDGNGPFFLKWLERECKEEIQTGGKARLQWMESGQHHFNSTLTTLQNFFEWYGYLQNFPPAEFLLLSVDKAEYKSKRTSSTHDALPIRVLNKMREILTANDYEWARGIEGDYFKTITGERVWSPCRAIAMLLMLYIPIRFDSLQSTDCGQEDEFVFDAGRGHFVKNPRPTAEKKRNMGMIREYKDASGKITGFFFVNNKTDHEGSKVQWDNPELRNELLRLRDFNQEHYGDAPRCHRSMVKKVTEGVKERFPDFYPLFRDLANSKPKFKQRPLAKPRFKNFFLLLLDETQKQLNEEDPERPIKLITSYITEANNNKDHAKAGTPKTSSYTPHSLRVTGITALALAGLPVTVIAEFIAGHASILMDLYYQKLGVSVISEIIDKAMAKIATCPELNSLELFRTDEAMREALMAASMSAEALKGLEDYDPGLWTLNKGFLCPNGGALCSQGNPEKVGRSGSNLVYSVVEGGEGNCPLCRFALAGPMTLAEQLLAHNVLIEKIGDEREVLRRLKNEMIEASRQSNRLRVRQLECDIEQKGRELVVYEKTEAARLMYLMQSIENNPFYERMKELQKKGLSPEKIRKRLLENQDEPKHTLLTRGNADDLLLSMRTEDDGVDKEEFYLTLALSGTFSQIYRSETAELKLAQLFDKMLKRHGTEPFLFSLDPDLAAAATVEMGYFLVNYYRQRGRKAVDVDGRFKVGQLLAGNRTLEKDDPSGKVIEDIKRFGEAVVKELSVPSLPRPKGLEERLANMACDVAPPLLPAKTEGD